MNDEQAVRDAVDRWFVSLNAMLNGDPAPFAEIFSHGDDVVYFSAEGTYTVGWQAVYADWTLQAEKALGGTAEGSDINIIVGNDMAVAHFRTTGEVKTPDGQTQHMKLRESTVFRKEAGQWKAVAHHADDLSVWETVVNR